MQLSSVGYVYSITWLFFDQSTDSKLISDIGQDFGISITMKCLNFELNIYWFISIRRLKKWTEL